ncbi:hypothetical protein OXX59_009843, partial [Metschnikowia pulcherrima]
MTTEISGKRVLMIDNYDSFTWNLYQYLCQSKYSAKVEVYRNDEVDLETIENVIKPDITLHFP